MHLAQETLLEGRKRGKDCLARSRSLMAAWMLCAGSLPDHVLEVLPAGAAQAEPVHEDHVLLGSVVVCRGSADRPPLHHHPPAHHLGWHVPHRGLLVGRRWAPFTCRFCCFHNVFSCVKREFKAGLRTACICVIMTTKCGLMWLATASVMGRGDKISSLVLHACHKKQPKETPSWDVTKPIKGLLCAVPY